MVILTIMINISKGESWITKTWLMQKEKKMIGKEKTTKQHLKTTASTTEEENRT